MKRIIKQVLGLVIALSIIISGIPNVMAASVSEFKDFPTGWSKVAMEAAVNNGLLVGFEGNEIRPENYLTRAEMATIIVRAFGAKTKVDISGYTDVLPSAWYYEYIEKIVKMGAMKGVSSSRMAPDDYITREEVFTTVARVLVLEDSDYDALSKYNDYSEISSWAKGYMSALAKRGYVNGDELGNANPKDNITREEFAQFMHNAIKTYITKSGTYSNDMNGIVVVRSGNVTLNNLSLTSDLVIADGVMEESVNINNVNVEKRLLTRGGTIKLTKTTLGENVVVNNVNGITHFKNYRTEKVFNGIVENTEASFLKQGAGGGSSYNPPAEDEWTVSFYDDKGNFLIDTIVKNGEKIDQSTLNLVNFHCKKIGYTVHWYDGTEEVTKDTLITKDCKLQLRYELITYKVIYHKEDGTEISGKDIEYNIEMSPLPSLWSPDESYLNGKLFSGWYTEANGGGYEVEEIPAISSNEVTELHLYMKLADKPTPPAPDKYVVTFYKGYGNDKRYGGIIDDVEKGSTIEESQYPAESVRRREVKYNKSMVDELFIDPGYVDYTYGTYWYVKGNQLLPFNDKVVINGNMDVYCLFKTFAPKITLSSYPDALLKLDLTYDDDTHMMTFTKNLGITAGDFLDKAIQMDQLPKYDEFKSKIEGLLLKSKLFDENKNIKVVNVPVPISKLIKQETAEDMIKQYIRDVINDSARLEEILSYVDIKDIIKGMSTEEFVASFTDKELLDIIKDPTNRDKIIKVVKDDVAKDGSVMLTPIVNYIKDNPTLISDDVIKEIADKEAESDLKTFVIGHLRTELNTDGSTLQTKIVSVINTELKDPDSDISKTILKYVKENLGKDTTQGSELRKMIINSSKLNDILNESGVKEEAIKFMLKDSFIDSMFANDAARKELLKTVIDNDTFLAALVESEEFISYIVERLHEHQDGDIGKDIENLLENETSKFREYLLDEVKDNNAFKKLIEDNSDLQTEIKNTVLWEDYITSDDKLLQYLFNQPGASNAGFEEFVTAAVLKKVEDKIEEQWNLKYPSNPYDGLTDVQKQDCKDELYLEEAYRTEVLNVAKSEFNTYKDKVINDLINGTKITDSGINKIINDLMVLYIEDYIELIPIFPTNNALNNEVYKTIEKILVHEVQTLVKDGITDADMEAELTTLYGHITTMKNAFVDEDDADIIADMKKLVKNFKQDNYSTMNGIITAEYSTLVTELVKLVQQVPVDQSMYKEVDSTIKTVASLIKDSSISTFMVNLANDPVECKKLILQYVKSLDDAGISDLVADYIDMNNDNKTAVKDEIDNILKTEDITSEVKKYVSLGSADTTISKFIDNGITEQFIHDNRTAIEEALLNVDISAFVTVEIVKEYVEELETTEEKKEFADKVYKSLTSSEIFSTFMDSLMNKDTFEVNSENVNIIELFRQAIEDLDFNEALKNMNNATLEKIFDSIGRDKFTGIFDRVKYEYTDGLEIVINNVKATGNKANYKTSLKLSVDPLNEVLVGLYEKGQDKVIEKLSEKMPYYNENPYLKGLVEHDVVSYLFDYDPAMKNDVYTGYKLKDNYMDYYDYMLSLFITADQAIQWFKVNGEGGFDEDEFKVLYDSVFGKIDYAYDKVNELLIDYSKDGKLPSQIKEILEKVQRVNEIFVNNEGKLKNVIDKYLDSELYIEGNIGDEERVVKMVDILLSQEDPAVTLDTVYSIFYNGTDKVRAKLQELIDSGKLEKAMNKFEETEIGKLMTDKGLGSVGDKITEIENTGKLESAVSSLYDLLIVFAEKGLEPFKVDKDVITVVDSYLFNVGQLSFQVSRKLM